MIHFGFHKCPMVDGKCREFVDETKSLIIEEVDRIPSAKIFMISLNANKTFVVKHLLDDNGNGTMEFLHGE
jgi:hypothetical protein